MNLIDKNLPALSLSFFLLYMISSGMVNTYLIFGSFVSALGWIAFGIIEHKVEGKKADPIFTFNVFSEKEIHDIKGYKIVVNVMLIAVLILGLILL